MKKILTCLAISFLLISCGNTNGKKEFVLPYSVGSTNSVLTVTKISLWQGKLGDEIRTVFGEHQVGLPQPETLLSMSQIDPSGFKGFMRNNKAVLIVKKGEKEQISVMKNKYAEPQVLVTATAKDEHDLINLIRTRGKEIIKIFKDEDVKFSQRVFSRKKLDEQKYETVRDLGISLTIPDSYRLVKDSIGFLWLRQHLSSGIARGDGSNNILLYSIPLEDETKVSDNITKVRDMIGEKHIPGSKPDMYMITEKAYTPHIFDVIIDGKKAYETRGKWELKNDFMAGPFINYTVVDKPNNRLVVFEGFTYAPSVNKRDFIFELEAIGKSMKIK